MSFANKGNYTEVNSTWPEVIPPLEPEEAMRAARRLYRLGRGQAWRKPIKLTSGNRYTWTRSGVLYVNPYRGWQHLVHDLAHLIHRKNHPEAKPHDGRHTWLEKQLVRAVIENGWLDGRLRKAPIVKPDPVAVRYISICRRLDRWQTRMRRASTAIKKLKRSKTRCENLGIGASSES